jgi:CHAD domain-containing protein
VTSLTENLEREVKFAVGLDAEIPDLGEAAGAAKQLPEQTLCAAYFDTSEFRLWDQRITFRHRTGEGPLSGTWTLKLPTNEQGPTLDREELSWAGGRQQIPKEAEDLLRGIVRRSALLEVVELTTNRRRSVLGGTEESPWAEFDDDVVNISGGPQDGLCFRQLELEVKPEGRGVRVTNLIAAVTNELRSAGARLENDPKLAKALGLRPVPAGRCKVDRQSTLDDVVKASIGNAVGLLLEYDVRLRLDLVNPSVEDVHQARVATRRLRSDLKTFRKVIDPIWLAEVRGELHWLGELLGEVRDLDVLMLVLNPDPSHSPYEAAGRTELRVLLRNQRRAASKKLIEVFASDDRYLDLLDRLSDAAKDPPYLRTKESLADTKLRPVNGKSARQVLPALVLVPWRAIRSKVREAAKDPSDTELHRIRIAAKQIRYAAEAASPVIGKPARRTAAAAKQVQTILGNHHDAVAAEQWLRTARLSASPCASFSAGQLTVERRECQKESRIRWRAAFDTLESSRQCHWLR